VSVICHYAIYPVKSDNDLTNITVANGLGVNNGDNWEYTWSTK